MKKVYLNVFSTFLVFMLLVCFSCKKSAPEVVEETPTESVQQEAEPEITTEEEPVKEEPVIEQKKEKISETQFKEIEDLIAKAKEAQADIYDKENFLNAKDSLNKAKAELTAQQQAVTDIQTSI